MKTLEIDISFCRDYFTSHFGIEYGPDYFDNIGVRAETDMKAKRALYERFGDIGLGEPDPEPMVQLGYDDTLNVTLMFGGQLRVESGISWVEPGFLDVEAIDRLACPAVENTWPHTRFMEQFEQAVRRFGPGSVSPPKLHGVLEQAMDLCGEAFLADLLTAPARAGRLLDVLAETVIRLKEFWDRVCFGDVRKGLSLGGCSTTMLSPDVVAAVLVPRYERIATRFGDAFICACGKTTHHLENWARIRGVRYVRCGWGTDLDAASELLSHRHIKAALDVVRAAELSPDELAADARGMLKTLEKVDHVSILLIHASARTPEKNARNIAEEVLGFARERDITLLDTATCKAGGR